MLTQIALFCIVFSSTLCSFAAVVLLFIGVNLFLAARAERDSRIEAVGSYAAPLRQTDDLGAAS